MCELCGQAHTDMVVVAGLTVCASKRHCMLYMLRTADELRIARMHQAAVRATLRALTAYQEQLAS